MTITLDKLIEEVMTLPSESRARLADLLVESLDAEELGRIDRWAVEVTRRRDEVRAGLVETVPGEEALRNVRESIRKTSKCH